EIQAGNSEFEEAFRTTENKLKNLHLKEVDWFLEHFAGSFALTLDEMNRI
ncbi:YfbR-like 5'-deoxynucleotidase, partial [Dialister invisus]